MSARLGLSLTLKSEVEISVRKLSADIGRAKRYPWSRSHPSSFRSASCSIVSTPSAKTRRPQDCASEIERLMVDCNQPTVAEFLKESARSAAVDVRFPFPIDVFERAHRIVTDGATIGEDIVEAHP